MLLQMESMSMMPGDEGRRFWDMQYYVTYRQDSPCAFDLLCLAHLSQSLSILILSLRSHTVSPSICNHPAYTAPDISPGINRGCPRGKAGGLWAQPPCHNKHRKKGGSKGSSSSKSLTIVSPQLCPFFDSLADNHTRGLVRRRHREQNKDIILYAPHVLLHVELH